MTYEHLFEQIEHDGVVYHWSGWQPKLRPLALPRKERWPEGLVACWQAQTSRGVAQCNVEAKPHDSDQRKEQLKENALNTIRQLVMSSPGTLLNKD